MHRAHLRLCAALALLVFSASCKDTKNPSAPSGPPAAAAISATTPASVTATVGDTVQLAVRVTTTRGEGVANVTVSFGVAAGGGSVSPASALTTASGEASAIWTLGTAPGTNTLTASVNNLAPATFTATTTAGVATQIAPATPVEQEGTPGSPVGAAPAVAVRDRFNNPVAGVAVTFEVTEGGGSVSGASATTNGQGVAAVASWTLGPNAGVNALTARTGSLAPVTFTATSRPGLLFDLVYTKMLAANVPSCAASLLPKDRPDCQWDIFLRRADGTEVNLTNTPNAEERWPRWSPDGRQIAFISNRDALNYHLYIMNADGSGVRQVPNTHPAMKFLWLDGSRILLTHFNLSFGIDFPSHTSIVDLARGTVTRTNPEVPQNAAVSSDGWLAWGSVCVVSPPPDEQRHCSWTFPNVLGFPGPLWTPSGNLILTIDHADVAHNRKMYWLQRDFTGLTRVTDRMVHGAEIALAVSPDGRYLAYMQIPVIDGGSGLTVIRDLHTGRESPTELYRPSVGAQWTPDGSYLLHAVIESFTSWFRLISSDGRVTVLISHNGHLLHPEWRPRQ
jgi:hypothetical protein